MSIPTHNIEYYHGDTYRMIAEFFRADGTSITLSAGEVRAFIVTDPADPDNTYVTEFDVIVSSSAAQLSILPAMAPSFVPGTTYYYDVEYTEKPADGQPVINRHTFYKGTINVEGGITHVDQ